MLLAGLGLGACAMASDDPILPGKGSSGSGGSSSGVAGSSTAGSTATPNGGAPVVPGPSTSGNTSGSSTTAGSGGAAAGSGGSAGGSGGSDANDLCPDDPNKTEPGKCGCGAPDEDSINGASCAALQTGLIHRYSFEGDANDSVGSAHGSLMGGATVAAGALTLAGGSSGQYLDLPNGLISKLTNATIEAWVTWTGSSGGMWQRVFDFGSSTLGEGQAGDGNKYLFLSTSNFRACYTSATPPSEIFADAPGGFPTAGVAHVAVVVNDTASTLSLYLDGNSVGGAALNLPLSAIDDVNNWLGRSQFAADEYFAGKISELRIYDVALTGPQLKTSLKMGESTTFLEPP